MKKFFVRFLLLTLLLIGVGITLIVINIDYLIKLAIENHGSQVLATEVSVEKVRARLKQGRLRIKTLKVANPNGFSSPSAIQIASISTKMGISGMDPDHIEVDKLAIYSPIITYEINDEYQDNFSILGRSLNDYLIQSGETASTDNASGLSVTVRDFIMNNGQLKLLVAPSDKKEYQLTVPDIRLHDIGGEDGVTPNQIASTIYKSIYTEIQTILKNKGIDTTKQRLGNKTENLVESKKAELKAELINKIRK